MDFVKSLFSLCQNEEKIVQPFTLSPQRHLFKLLALLDVKNVVVKAHTVNCSSPPCQHKHTPAQGWRDTSPVTPQRHSLDGLCGENKRWVVHEEEEGAFQFS